MGSLPKILGAKDDMLSTFQEETAPADFPFEANAVRARLGWSEEEFRSAKKTRLDDGDFVLVKKMVFLSERAVAKLANGLPVSPPVRPQTVPGSPSPRELRVVRVNLPNPRVILACAEKDNPDKPREIVRVRIREGTPLRRRELIQARVIPPYTDFYEHVPPRGRRV